MRILITGALGHIGSRLIRELPVGVVSDATLMNNNLTQRYASLFDLPEAISFRFVEDDICAADLEAYTEDVQAVVHLAAITHAPLHSAESRRARAVNTEGTRRVVRACARRGCKLLFVSTTSVYSPRCAAVDEDCGALDLQPQNPYAATKLDAEAVIRAAGEAVGLRFIICRFGTVFGPSLGMRFHTAVNKFIMQACTGRPISVWRTALHQTRPYLDMTDAIRAINFILVNDLFDNRIYNVLTANATVADILDHIAYFVPGMRLESVDSPLMNDLSYTVANQKLKDRGFLYEGSLRRGIGDTIRLLRGINSASHFNLDALALAESPLSTGMRHLTVRD